MTRHYSTRDFFRQMPNALLARYFSARDVLTDFDFTAIKETRIDTLFDAWMELPEAARVRLETELREICDVAWGAGGLAGVALMTIDRVSLLPGRRASASA
jgi:hypothetical protein